MHKISLYLLSLFLIVAGVFHFIVPDFYFKMMPSYLPYPKELILISGAAEVGLGIGLMIRPFTRYAAWGIILLLIAVFPANVHLALHPEIFPGTPAILFWLRLPFQFVLILWAYPPTKIVYR